MRTAHVHYLPTCTHVETNLWQLVMALDLRLACVGYCEFHDIKRNPLPPNSGEMCPVNSVV